MTDFLKILQSALRNEDVEGLIASGAPSDEYDAEAEAAVKALSNISTETTQSDIISALVLVWTKFFNLSQEEVVLRLPAFKKIAQSVVR